MVLDPFVAGLVLMAALMHASWNALVKSETDRQTTLALVMLGGLPFGIVLLAVTGGWDGTGMTPAAWQWLAASVTVHCAYYACLLQAYRFGDLSHVYPIARGLGPLLVALASGLAFAEALSVRELTGVAIVSAGIASLALGGRHAPAENRHALVFAVMTGLCIATYTVIDARGVRAAVDPFAYVGWLSIVEAPWIALYCFARRGRGFGTALRLGWRRGLAGGLVASLGYAITLWAFSRSGAAHVAALREISVIFAAVIGAVVLGEGFGWRRILATLLVAGGLLLMNWKG